MFTTVFRWGENFISSHVRRKYLSLQSRCRLPVAHVVRDCSQRTTLNIYISGMCTAGGRNSSRSICGEQMAIKGTMREVGAIASLHISAYPGLNSGAWSRRPSEAFQARATSISRELDDQRFSYEAERMLFVRSAQVVKERIFRLHDSTAEEAQGSFDSNMTL
jgi:hypothetical protein